MLIFAALSGDMLTPSETARDGAAAPPRTSPERSDLLFCKKNVPDAAITVTAPKIRASSNGVRVICPSP
jgi:hypothetical protein